MEERTGEQKVFFAIKGKIEKSSSCGGHGWTAMLIRGASSSRCKTRGLSRTLSEDSSPNSKGKGDGETEMETVRVAGCGR